MVTAPLSSTWDLLGSAQTSGAASSQPTFYRRLELYDLAGTALSQLDLDDHWVVPAPLSGPIAVMRDPHKPVLLTSDSVAYSARKHTVSIFSSSGLLLQVVQWDTPTKIVQLGWTASEQLVILTQDGTYRLYPLTVNPSSTSTPADSPYTQHSLGTEVQDNGGVLEAKIWSGGLVALLANLQFVEVRGWGRGSTDPAFDSTQDPNRDGAGSGSGPGGKGKSRIRHLAQVALDRVPDCWCVVPPEASSTRGIEVLLGTGGTVLRLDEIEVQDQRLSRGPFASIKPSPSGRFLALLTRPTPTTYELWVTSSDFSRSLSEFDLTNEGGGGGGGDADAPKSIEWCGSNSVVVAWDRLVVMVGPFGETLKYYYADPVRLVGEMDGTRIISNETCDFLQIVPQSSQSIFLPGSTSPASILFEASELFSQRSPKADEYVRSIQGDLVEAVDRCIDAAGREWDVVWQKKLLQAAAFGKSFLEVYNPSEFVNTTKSLRILHAVRDYKVGIPLTLEQFNARPLSSLVARLTSRSQHLLALRISSFLGLSPSPVLRHWAQHLIVASSPSQTVLGTNALPRTDEEVCDLIVRKLESVFHSGEAGDNATSGRNGTTATVETIRGGRGGGTGPIPVDLSSADIALTAFALGRTRLALMLVEKEARADKKVRMLERMGEVEQALREAEQSGDPDLVYLVLLPLLETRSSGDVFRLLPAYPLATSLLQQYALASNRTLLRDFYYVDDRRWEGAVLDLAESLDEVEFGNRVEKVRKAAKRFGEDKEYGFEAKMTEEHVKLLILQQTLESESPTQRKYVGLSVNETIRACILDRMDKKVDKIKKDYAVPDKRLWHVKLKALIQARDWDALDAFARSRKSPIGYEPWVEALIRAGAQRQAIKYVERCEARNRVELFVKAGEWVMAGEEAVRRGERGKLIDLKSRSPNTIIAAQLDELIASMDQAGM
ncbi:hypothetical protein JCM10212_006659 [Sporobolomyces blumeae]